MGVFLYLAPVVIRIEYNRKVYRYKVERLPSSGSFDFYRIIARNKTVDLRNNDPVLKRHNLKHRPRTWQVISGNISISNFEQKIIDEVEKLYY